MRLGRPSMQHQKLELAAALNQSPIVAGAMQMSKPTTTRCVTPPSKERCCSQQYHMNVGKRWSCSIEITPIPSSVITDACSKCVCVCVCGRKKSGALVLCCSSSASEHLLWNGRHPYLSNTAVPARETVIQQPSVFVVCGGFFFGVKRLTRCQRLRATAADEKQRSPFGFVTVGFNSPKPWCYGISTFVILPFPPDRSCRSARQGNC